MINILLNMVTCTFNSLKESRVAFTLMQVKGEEFSSFIMLPPLISLFIWLGY